MLVKTEEELRLEITAYQIEKTGYKTTDAPLGWLSLPYTKDFSINVEQNLKIDIHQPGCYVYHCKFKSNQRILRYFILYVVRKAATPGQAMYIKSHLRLDSRTRGLVVRIERFAVNRAIRDVAILSRRIVRQEIIDILKVYAPI